MSSADNLCKQFGPRSVSKNVGPALDLNYLTLLIVFLKEFFQKVDFKKKVGKITRWQRVNHKNYCRGPINLKLCLFNET